jgi:hypothetical protein
MDRNIPPYIAPQQVVDLLGEKSVYAKVCGDDSVMLYETHIFQRGILWWKRVVTQRKAVAKLVLRDYRLKDGEWTIIWICATREKFDRLATRLGAHFGVKVLVGEFTYPDLSYDEPDEPFNLEYRVVGPDDDPIRMHRQSA